MGFFCRHAYAHGHERASPLPDTLKGTDMEVWEVMSSLGLHPRIRPVITSDSYDSYIERNDGDVDLPDIHYGGDHGCDDMSESDALDADLDEGNAGTAFPAFIVGKSGGAFYESSALHAPYGSNRRMVGPWAGEDSRGIHWISPPKHYDLQETYMAVSLAMFVAHTGAG